MAYRTQQRYITFLGVERHFVSYEGHPANPRKALEAMPPMWYLVQGGRRWAAIEEVLGQEETETERLLTAWLEAQGFTERPPEPRPPERGMRNGRVMR